MTARTAADLAALGIPCTCGHAPDEHRDNISLCEWIEPNVGPCLAYTPDEDRICRDCGGYGGWSWTVEVDGRDRDDERECRTCGGTGVLG